MMKFVAANDEFGLFLISRDADAWKIHHRFYASFNLEKKNNPTIILDFSIISSHARIKSCLVLTRFKFNCRQIKKSFEII